MPRPVDKRSADDLADEVAGSYLEFAKIVKEVGCIDKLSVMELVISSDILNIMKKDLSKLAKSIENRLRFKIIEEEQLKIVEETNYE